MKLLLLSLFDFRGAVSLAPTGAISNLFILPLGRGLRALAPGDRPPGCWAVHDGAPPTTARFAGLRHVSQQKPRRDPPHTSRSHRRLRSGGSVGAET